MSPIIIHNTNIHMINTQYYQESYEPYVPAYDGNSNLQIFLDWIHALEEFFAWHNFSYDRCLCYVGMKLIGPAKYYWKLVLHDIE